MYGGVTVCVCVCVEEAHQLPYSSCSPYVCGQHTLTLAWEDVGPAWREGGQISEAGVSLGGTAPRICGISRL